MSLSMLALVTGMVLATGPEPIPQETYQILDFRGRSGATRQQLFGGRPDPNRPQPKPGLAKPADLSGLPPCPKE